MVRSCSGLGKDNSESPRLFIRVSEEERELSLLCLWHVDNHGMFIDRSNWKVTGPFWFGSYLGIPMFMGVTIQKS